MRFITESALAEWSGDAGIVRELATGNEEISRNQCVRVFGTDRSAHSCNRAALGQASVVDALADSPDNKLVLAQCANGGSLNP